MVNLEHKSIRDHGATEGLIQQDSCLISLAFITNCLLNDKYSWIDYSTIHEVTLLLSITFREMAANEPLKTHRE